MTKYFLVALYFVVASQEAFGDGENEVNRRDYPFMAFIYYPDGTVLDSAGSRFMRSAVLIRPDWLVTSAIGPSELSNESEDFPKKTLLARLGAISIDPQFTFNEDENEQEREVIKIVRPYNHSATQWWLTDITLMKTLFPFNMTAVVRAVALKSKVEYAEKICIALVYAKKSFNTSDDIVLMQLSVQMLPPSLDNCGRHYVETTMICAADSEEKKSAVYDTNYCRRNSGGPLICEGDVIGLQTYINNDCHQPYLYQLLSAWESFIICGTDEKCHEEQCSNICIASDKDVSITEDIFTTTSKPEVNEMKLVDANSVANIFTATPALDELTKDDEEQTPTPTIEVKTTSFHTISTFYSLDTSSISSWPPTINESTKLTEDNDTKIRKANVEAHQQDTKLNAHSGVQRNVFAFKILLCGITLCLV